MSWASGLLSVHWLSVCWANGKREGEEKKKEKWGRTGNRVGRRERGSSFYTGEALFEWKDGFVFSSMQLSLNLHPTWGAEGLRGFTGVSWISKSQSTVPIIHYLSSPSGIPIWPQCEIDTSELTDTVCLKGTKGCAAGQISLTCYTF